MTEYEVLGGASAAISFAPGSTVAEILQNVRTILTTPKYFVPLDREFGLSATMLDDPLPAAQARLTAEIFSAVQKWEPRVRVTRVSYVNDALDAMDGKLVPKVRLRIVATE